MAFVHLHTHTAYSLLDGAGTIPKLLDRAKELGQTAMAITDHGNMYGVIEFYEAARERGIKPILGCEVYVAARSRFDKVHEYDSSSYHLILLPENDIGYHNLMKLVSIGFVDGYYYRPRIDMEVLRQYSDGLIALSACMAGVLSKNILSDNYEEAKRRALEFIDIFGRDRYFVEIQDHGIVEQQKLNRGLIALAKELDLQLVATNDIHYVRRENAENQDVLMCIQMGKTVDDEDRLKMSTDQLYLKSEAEMEELFSYVPQALENTQKIADRCNVEIEFGKLHLPKFDVPEGLSSYDYLKQLTDEGFRERYPNDNGTVRQRLDYELSTIAQMGYVDYFLIVWDFIRYARENGIMVGPGRGSAAGSVVSYCLHITNIDPIRYSLIFERFLNPERVSMPDIDIDFCYERRGEVIDYVNRKYGKEQVCQIVTFGTMAARLAVRDVGRALNVPYGVVDEVAKQIPMELKMTIEKALTVNYKLKELYDGNPQIKQLIDTAKELEGLPRHTSTHAAGVVITREPVQNYVPLQMNDDVITTQFTMTTIERLGLLKMDFLGLRTLTVIRDAVAHVKRQNGVELDMGHLAFDDEATYAMISAGDTDGVFQLESGGMRQFMKELKPDSLEDIIAGISLYRPGPMDSIPMYIANKNNPDKIRYKHPMLEHILNMTYGCIVYQEQVMQIVRELGGYSLGRADLVRRAMSKKKADVMEKERKNFIYGTEEDGQVVDGAVKRGVDEQTASAIFDEMMDFASYAFNKSHAAAYAVVAYQTAWLKCHYPVAFFAALLTSFVEHSDKVTKYIAVVKSLGITVLPPDINKSGRQFSVDGDRIRFGMAAVKNVGGAVVDEIVAERENGGEFKGFRDFCQRMAGRKVNKRVIENLIRCGAFDSFGLKRAVLMNVYEKVLDDAVSQQKNVMPGQLDMFSTLLDEPGLAEDNFPDCEEFDERDILAMEKESIGMYVSGHPLNRYRRQAERCATAQIYEIVENEEHRFNIGSKVTLTGIINHIRNQLTKKGEIMRYLELEDLTGTIEVLVFPSLVRKFDTLLREDAIVAIEGNLDLAEDAPPKLRLESIHLLTDAPPAPKAEAKKESQTKLYVRLIQSDRRVEEMVKAILRGGEGDIPVILRYEDKKQTLMAGRALWVSLGDGREEQLIALLGAENVKLVEK
ncbi:MAG: DNA polymerase III subunit alpha [Clostridia bacterium]|nr:DNA polymerase III subunit alpha [Clostridia bacterium]